jgi:hypothetical protein
LFSVPKQRKKMKMMQILGIGREAPNERYLGLPVYVGRSKSKVFRYLKERLWAKIIDTSPMYP